MIKYFTYDVKLIIQHNVNGTLEFVTRTFSAEVEIGEFDYYIPYTVYNENVKNDMEMALQEFADSKGYDISDLQVITTEVSTNDDTIDISFSQNASDNSYQREPNIEVEFIPQKYKPNTPQYFRGDYDIEGFIYWQWENVPNCAYRIYDEKNKIIGEIGVEQRFFIEQISELGANYTRKIVSFNTDGESEPSKYFVVYVPESAVNDSPISENRFGYIDVGEITPASVNVGKISCFKSGIGDSVDLFTQPSAYTTYEKYSFDTVIEGYLVNKQKHYTSVPVTYKIIAEGVKHEDGPIDGEASISVKPWPITTVKYSLTSVVFDDIKIDFSWNVRVTFQKKSRVITNADSGLGQGSGGSGGGGTGGNGGSSGSGSGNWIGGLGTDESHNWSIEVDGNIYSPNDIIWNQISGDGSIIFNTDGTVIGDLPGDFILEGTLPNGDKIIVEGEVLPPAISVPSGSDTIYDKEGNPLPPVTPAAPGENGDGGGTAGGIIPRPDQQIDDDHDVNNPVTGNCPCIYIYETTSTTLKFTVGGKLMDNTMAVFDIHKNPPKYNDTIIPPEYIEGCLCCKETDDISAISIDADGVLTGNHVGRSHVYCTYKEKTFHFHVHVVPLYIRIKPDNHSMRVGENVQYELYRSSHNNFSDEVRVEAMKWTIDNKCTIEKDGLAEAFKHGKYKVYAKYFGKETEANGIILEPDMEYDYSTSHNPNVIDSYYVKLDRKITARILINGTMIDAKILALSIEDTSIASIDDTGVISGIREGTTKLTATYRGYSIETNVTVIDRVVTISPTEEYDKTYDFAIYSGDTQQIKVYDDGARVPNSELTFSSKSTELKVDNNGLVTGEKTGSGTIVVTYRKKTYEVDGLILQSTLTVEPNPAVVEVEGDAVVNVFRNGTEVYDYTLQVSDTTYASVSGHIITGKVIGTTTLKAVYKDLSCTVDLEVIPDPDPDNRYTLKPSGSIKLGVGVDATFTAEKRNNSGVIVPLDMDITWELVGGKELGELNPITGEFTSYLTPNIPEGDTYFIENLQDAHRVWHGDLLVKAHFKNDLYEFSKIFSPSISKANPDFNGISSPIELWMWRPTIDPEHKKLSAKFNVREMSYMFRKNAIIDVGQCDVEIYNKNIIQISDDGVIIPLSAGSTCFDLTVYGITETMSLNVHDYVEIVMEDGSPINAEQDVLVPFRVGLRVNNIMENPDNYTVIAGTNTKIENGCAVVGQVRGSADFKIIYKDKEYIHSTYMKTPKLRIEFDIAKEPEAISPTTKKPWPDLYKYKKDTTATFKAYINDVLIDESYVNIEFDEAYGSKLNRINNTLSSVTDCIQRLYFVAKGSDALAIELEFGSLSLSHNDIKDITVGSTFSLQLLDSSGKTVSPVSFKYKYASDTYVQNFDVFLETLEDKVYGQCCSNTYTSCKVVQGGMKNRLTLIYMPKIGSLPMTDKPMLETLYGSRFVTGVDYRPRFYETTIESVPVTNAAAYYMGRIISKDLTMNPNRIRGNYDSIHNTYDDTTPHIYAYRGGSNNVNSIVIAPKKKKSEMTSDDYSYINFNSSSYFKTEKAINKQEEGIVRVDGQEFDVIIDYRYILDMMYPVISSHGGCPKDKVPATIANLVYDWMDRIFYRGDAKGFKLGSLVERKRVSYEEHYHSGPPTWASSITYHSINSFEMDKVNYIAGDVTTDNTDITISSSGIQVGDNANYGAIEIRTNVISDKYTGTKKYIHVRDKNDSTPILESEFSNLILPLNTVLKLDKSKVTYAYEEIDESELKFGKNVSGSFNLLDDMKFIANSKGYATLPIIYKDIALNSKLLYISSDTPEIIYNSSRTMDIGRSIEPSISIDGFSTMHDIPTYRYCKITSSNPNIVYVSKYNVMTSKNVGECTITIEFMNSRVEYKITVSANTGRYIYSDSSIIGPMEISTLTAMNENGTPWFDSNETFEWSIYSGESDYCKLTPNGSTATFLASKYGTYVVRCKIYIDGKYDSAINVSMQVKNVSGKATSTLISTLSLRENSDTLLPYKPSLIGYAANDSYIRMQKAYNIDISEGYFEKTKDMIYSGNLTIQSSVISKEIADLMAFVMKDSEVAASPAGTVKIVESYMESCNRDDVVIEEYDNKLYLTCGAEDAKYSCVHSGLVTLDVEENNNVPLIDLSELVWTNQSGSEYSGSKMPSNKLSYSADRSEIEVIDINNNSYPTDILNAMPILTTRLKEPTDIYNKDIVLDDTNNKEIIYLADMINNIKHQNYKLELLLTRNKGNLSAKDTKDVGIKFGSVKYIKASQSDDWGLIVECKPEVLTVPWNESSGELYCDINGKMPMRNDGDGIQPYQTIAETFDTTNVITASYSVQIIDSDGKDISASFENEVIPGVTTVNGDILTFSSNYYELADVYVRVICSTIESKSYEIDSGLEETIISDIYNPLHDYRWSKSNLVNTRISAVSKNPNVVVYPVNEEIDFNDPAYASSFKIPYEFKAYILSPSQGCWAPTIHPGYYYLNNDEHFLYRDMIPNGEYSDKVVSSLKELFVNVRTVLEVPSSEKDILLEYRDTFSNGTLDNTVIVNGDITLDASALGTYTSIEYKLIKVASNIVFNVYGDNLEQTTYEYSILEDGLWKDWESLQDNSEVSSASHIEAVRIRVQLNSFYTDTTTHVPLIRNMTITCKADLWEFARTLDKTVLCSVPMDKEWHNATDKTIKNLIYPDIAGSGLTNPRIKSININTLEQDVDLEYEPDGSTPLKARTHEEATGIMATKYFKFDETGMAIASPIPRLGRPICIKSKDKYLRHVTCYDKDGNLTLSNREEFLFDGVMAIALTYHDIDNLKIMLGDKEVPIKKQLNNMVYLDSAYKIELGSTLVATYNIRNSFYVDYNYDIPNNKSKIQVYLNEADSDFESIEVWYEVDDDGEYYADEVEINPLYNVLNSGFIYIADETNTPSKIEIFMTDTEFKFETDEYTYAFVRVTDSIGNPVSKITVEAQTLNGRIEIEDNVTNKFGIVRIKYLPITKTTTVDQLLVSVAGTNITDTQEIKIVDAISPVFMIVKPVDGEYIVSKGDSIKVSVQLLTDYLSPSKFTPVRIQLLGDKTTNASARTNDYGYCEFEIPAKINKDLDICRLEVTSIGVTEYLDLKVV